MPGLRDDDRVLLASVAAWAVVGATPALAGILADEATKGSSSKSEGLRDALKESIESTLGSNLSMEVEEAGRTLVNHVTGRGTNSPQSRTVVARTELQLAPVTHAPPEMLRDPSGKAYVAHHLGPRAQEAFWVIPIDAANQARAIVEIGIGEFHSVGAPYPAVLGAVLTAGTDLFWVAHNHPSGVLEASRADVEMTKALSSVAQIVGLHLTDHLIVGSGSATWSLADHGKHVADWGDLAGEGHSLG